MKRILSVILSIMLIVGLVPMMAFAETTEDTTDIKTSLGLDYTVYDADPGDAVLYNTTTSLTKEALVGIDKLYEGASSKATYTSTAPKLYLDLGRTCDITGVVLYAGYSVNATRGSIRYSNDKETWTDADSTQIAYSKSYTDGNTPAEALVNSGAAYARYFKFNETVTARYLEVTNTSTASSTVQLVSINVYGTLPSATKLSALTVANATLGAAFDPAVTEYTAEISTYENMPVVSATAETEGATVTITQATQETMKATVEVAYEGEATRTYTINFTEPSIPAMTSINYTNGVLSWGIPTHTNLTQDAGRYAWTNVDGTTVRVPCVQVDVYDENEALVKTLDINHIENQNVRLTSAFYFKPYIDEAGTYKVSAALKTADGTLGEKIWYEGIVIDDNVVVSLPENGATAVGKSSNQEEEVDVTESLLSPEVKRASFYNKNISGYVIITLPAPAQVSSIMAHQQGYKVRGTYSYSLDGVTWTALVAGTDITVPSNDSAYKGTYSSSGYTYIPVKDGKEFVAKYIKYEHPSLGGNYGVNQIYVNGQFVDVDYTDLALTESEGKVTASVKGQYVLDSTPSTDGSAVLFTATYKVVDGKKVLVSISDRTTIKGYSLAEAVAKSVEVNAPTEAGTYVVKAFLFNNMSTIVPLVASPEITITVQ